MIVPRSEIGYTEWETFAFAHGGWIFHSQSWLDYELTWGGTEDHSFAVLHGDRIEAIVPLLVQGGQARANGEVQPGALGMNWRTALQNTGFSGPFRQQPTLIPTDSGWITRVIDTSLTEAALWADLRHSIKSPIRRLQETHDVVPGPLAGQMLERLYAEQAGALPVIPAAGWAIIWELAAKGWLQFYAAVERETGRCAGAVGIYHHGDWSYYGHGRSAAKNINAMLLWHVITHPPARYLEVGWMDRPGDDAKAQAIAHHKRALGGQDWWVPTWSL